MTQLAESFVVPANNAALSDSNTIKIYKRFDEAFTLSQRDTYIIPAPLTQGQLFPRWVA